MTTLAAFAPALAKPAKPVEQAYLLTLGSTVKNARTLAYAKALAPQMFQRLGSQVMFQTITITKQSAPHSRVGGETIAIYNRKGWHDVKVEPRPHKPATVLEFPLAGGAPQTEGIPAVMVDTYTVTPIDAAAGRPNGVVTSISEQARLDEEVAF